LNNKFYFRFISSDVKVILFTSIFLTIKPTRCINFSNLFLEWNSICFGWFICPSSGVFRCTHNNGMCHTGLLCLQWKTPDDGQRNCPKHVEFPSKNEFGKLVHLVGFITRNLTRCTVTWTSNYINPLNAELNPICYLLALLGARHFLHVSRIRVKSLTLRLLMSYTYGAPILDVSRLHTTTHHGR